MNQEDWFGNGAQWMRTWFDFTSKMAEAAGACSTANPFSMPTAWSNAPAEAARQMRGDVLQAWSEHFDRFMRSPDFLRWMQSALGTSLEMQQRVNDALGEAQHRLQGATRQDIDELMRTIERVEDQVGEMSAQLSELTARLEATEELSPRPSGVHRRHTAEINGRSSSHSEEGEEVEEVDPRPANGTRRRPARKRPSR